MPHCLSGISPIDNTVKKEHPRLPGRCHEGNAGADRSPAQGTLRDEASFSFTLTHWCFDAHHAAALHGACRFDYDFRMGRRVGLFHPKRDA